MTNFKVTANSLFAGKRTEKYIFNICLLTVCLILGKLFFTGISFFVINSSSMEPLYPAYSVVAVKRDAFDNLKIGDVIVYKSDALNGGLAFHRITRITEDGIYTKGDNNDYEDSQLITADSYVGKEAFKITFFAKYLTLIQRTSGLFVFFVLPVLIITMTFVSVRFLKKAVKKL